MDIGAFNFRGVPLAWISPSGFTAAGLRDGSAMGWLRSFGGGLLATCGLDAFGSPSPVIEGRAAARERGQMPILAPGESRSYTLEFEVRDI